LHKFGSILRLTRGSFEGGYNVFYLVTIVDQIGEASVLLLDFSGISEIQKSCDSIAVPCFVLKEKFSLPMVFGKNDGCWVTAIIT
jgi:hypothetical protein